MIQVKDVLDRARPLAVAGTFLAVLGLTAVAPWQTAHAEVLAERSLLTTSSQPSLGVAPALPAGHPQNGNAVGHTYSFTADSTATITSITFEAWDSAFGHLDTNGNYTPGSATGAAPTGFSASGVASQTITTTIDSGSGPAAGPSLTGASVSANTWSLSGSLALGAGDKVVLTFPNVFVNPSTAYTDNTGFSQKTYFVHIRTLSTGSVLEDSGTVTSAVTPSIDITTRVQETLRFSVEGAAITDNSEVSFAVDAPTTPGATCAPLTAGTSIKLGDTNNALAPNRAYFAGSYFRLATNSASGAIVYYSGETLKSGSTLSIDPIGAAVDTSSPGSEQFGLTVASINNAVAPTLVADSAYDITNGFAFRPFVPATVDADEAAAPVRFASSPGVVDCDTGEMRYIANMANDTEAGIYTTRINYIASPSY